MAQMREFTFQWPMMLWLLALVPLLVLGYLMLARQHQVIGLNSAGATLGVQNAKGFKGMLERHGMALLLLLGISALLVAVARPNAVVVLPTRMDTIILAMDISGSMRASDIKPNRLMAAQGAATTLIANQPSGVRIGVVSMASTAALVQSPTTQREDVIAAINRLQLQRGTALGSGVVIALATLLPDSHLNVEQIIFGRSSPSASADATQVEKFKPVPPGSNHAFAIVLLSDGVSNFGPDLLEVAKLAAERGVRIYTVGIGTTKGDTLRADGWSMRVRLDEEVLKAVANVTHGEYFQASSAGDLKKIYQQLGAQFSLGQGRVTELTALCIALGAALALLSMTLSLLRFNRVL